MEAELQQTENIGRGQQDQPVAVELGPPPTKEQRHQEQLLRRHRDKGQPLRAEPEQQPAPQPEAVGSRAVLEPIRHRVSQDNSVGRRDIMGQHRPFG